MIKNLVLKSLFTAALTFLVTASSSWADEIDQNGFLCSSRHVFVLKPHEIRVCYRRDAQFGTQFVFKVKNVYFSERKQWNRSLFLRIFLKPECGSGLPDQPEFPHTVGDGAVGNQLGADFFASRYEVISPGTDELTMHIHRNFCSRSFVRAYTIAAEGEYASSLLVKKDP
jgi:hypothetical protein